MYLKKHDRHKGILSLAGLFSFLAVLSITAFPAYAGFNDCAIDWNRFNSPGYTADYTYKGQIIRDHESTGSGDPSHGQANVPPDATDLASGATSSINPGPNATPSFGYYDGGTQYDPTNLSTMNDDYIFFRMRLTGDPSTNKDDFKSYHWNVLFDIDADGYKEYWIDIDGGYDSTSKDYDRIQVLYDNRNSQVLNPDEQGVRVNVFRAYNRDIAGSCPAGSPGRSHTRVRPANDGTGDYFIEEQIPMTAFKDSNGNQLLYPDSPVAFVFSTGASNQDPLQKDWMMDLNYLSDADPITFGDIIIPQGTPIIEFADVNLNFVSLYSIGANVYIYLNDRFANRNQGVEEFVDVTVTDPVTGDDEVVRLRETGPNTGIFVNKGTGSTILQTVISDGTFNNSDNSGSLEVLSKNTIYVSYTNSRAYTVTDKAVMIGTCDALIQFTRANGLPSENFVLTNNQSTSDKLYVTITDFSANTNPNTQQTITVSLSGNDSQTLTLTETGNNTGVFRNTAGLNTMIAVLPIFPNDSLWEDNDGGAVTATYNYQCGGSSRTETTRATLFVVPGGGRVYFTDIGGTLDVELYGPGQQVYLKVVDFTNCAGGAAPIALTVTVTSSSGDSESVTLRETFPGSGVFRNIPSLLTTATFTGTFVRNNGLLEASDRDTLTVTYQDCNDGDNEPSNNNKTDTAKYNAPVIVINEVLFYPEKIVEQSCQTEYVQLYNASTAAVNVTGYRITDGDGFTFIIPQFNNADIMLASRQKLYVFLYEIVPQYQEVNGTYYLFAQSYNKYCAVSNTPCATDSNCSGGDDVCISFPSDDFGDPRNSSPSDQILLYNSGGEVVDYVAWSSTITLDTDFLGDDSPAVAKGIWQDDAFVNVSTVSPGWSIRRTSDGFDSNTPNDWSYNQTAKICEQLVITRAVISSFSAGVENGRTVVTWTTASETGTVGFYLYRLDKASGEYLQVNDRLLPGLLTAPQGGTYRYVDNNAFAGNSYEYLLVEVESSGKNNTYGPYRVQVNNHLSAFGMSGKRHAGYSRAAHELSARRVSQATAGILADGTIQDIEKSRYSALSRKSSPSLPPAPAAPSQTAVGKITVGENGLYFINKADISFLLQGGTANSALSSQLSLKNRGKDHAYLVADNNAGIYFYGVGIESLYTDKNVYRLEKGKATLMESISGRSPVPASVVQTFFDTVHYEEDLWTATGLFTDPESDYWLWDYIVADDPDWGSISIDIHAGGVAGVSGSAILTVNLVGATNTDHHVSVSMNGTEIGESTWYGAKPHTFSVSFSQSHLTDGNNTVRLNGLLDAGVPYSIVYIDSLDLSYHRLYRAENDQLLAKANGNPVVTAEGFTDPKILVFDVTRPDKVKLIQGTTIDSKGTGNYRASFMPSSPASVYFILSSKAIKSPLSVLADNPSQLRSRTNSADYLVITPKELKGASQALADYRKSQGLKTAVVEIEDIMDEFSDSIFSPEAIRKFLTYAYYSWNKAPRYVALAGKGTEDYKDRLGYGTNLMPPFIISTPDGLFPSDNRYADVNGDHVPEMSIGRLPAVSSQELQNLLNKIISYESSSGGDWKNRILMLADYPEPGGNFPADSDAVAALVPSQYTTEKIYLSDHSVTEARSLTLNGINRGAVVLNYIGHAGFDRLSQDGLLTTDDVALMNNMERLPVLTAMTCLTGDHTVPGLDTLGEALILKQNGGAIAVFSPSGMSMNPEAVALDKAFFQSYLVDNTKVLGDIVRKTLEKGGIMGVSGYIMDLYGITGDPALRLK